MAINECDGPHDKRRETIEQALGFSRDGEYMVYLAFKAARAI